ncbi:MAG TPA: O-antigen ligase family protein, partial [Armatimonadota bacterium]|nr:O-antigen ligase family protein [Armatimonadota bacterium]
CVTLFGWLIRLLLRKETFRWRAELGWMLGFSFAMLLSGYRTPAGAQLVTAAMDAARLALLFLMFQQILNTRGRVQVALHWLLVMTVVLAAFAIHGYFTGAALNEHGTLRAIVNVGDFDDPNDLAAALVIPVPLALLLLLRGRHSRVRWAGLFALGVLVLGIYLCDSRGGMIALGVGTGIFLIYQLGWTRGCLLAAGALALMLAFGPSRFSADKLAGDDSSQGRVLAWQAGLNMFEHSHLLGVGYNQFEKHHDIPAHNSFMHGLGEGGLLTAFTWVGLNYWALLQLVRLRRRRQEEEDADPSQAQPAYAVALLAGLVASLAAGMFLSHTYRPVPLLPVALAAALACAGGLPRPRRLGDWVHYLAVALITVGGIALMYVLVTVLL